MFPLPQEYEQHKAQGRLPPLKNRACKAPPIKVKDGMCQSWVDMYSKTDHLKIAIGLMKKERRGITW